ncbi:hypothetical protein IJD44_05555 [bacterium]|nr:hypothetical protein [bacterium]
MISTKEVKVKITSNLTSEYIENELKKQNLDVLRWAIVNTDDCYYYINIAYVD